MKDILNNGYSHPDRTKTGRRSVFGRMMRFDLTKGFPLVTTRSIPFKNPVKETLWFIQGNTDANYLADRGCNIWNAWSVQEKDIDEFLDKNPKLYVNESDRRVLKKSMLNSYLGSIGPMYGAMWRQAPDKTLTKGDIAGRPLIHIGDIASDKFKLLAKAFENDGMTASKIFSDDIPEFDQFCNTKLAGTIDQLQELMVNLKNRPHSSRHVITAWIPQFIPYEELSPQQNVIIGKGALAPCHVLQQYYVSEPITEGGRKRLSLMLTIRSNDIAIGAPSNIAQYALLLSMIAQCVGMEAYELVYSIGDAHLYENHLIGAREQIKRTPLELPTLRLDPSIKCIYDFKEHHIELKNYQMVDPPIKYPISV